MSSSLLSPASEPYAPLPSPTAILQYLQIRPSSQHGMAVHKLRGRNVSAPASADVLRLTSINSGMADFDVEEGVPRADLPWDGTEQVTTRPLFLASDRNTIGSDPSRSEALPERASIQIVTEEPALHASILTLPPRARNNEMAEEIISLRTQTQ
ncbi:hypothetical protein IW262DRAFT_1468190 [Armillaria fumosa]|nr:hypothetical protein IW262DRAFT_1468190 [Armillaria fumosa]